MKKKLTKSSVQKTAAYKFERGHSSRLSQKDVEAIGPALVEIAERHVVDLPMLDPRIVLEEIERDPEHIIWQHLDRDPKKAMREWLLEQLRLIIQGVRVVRADVPQIRARLTSYCPRDADLKGSKSGQYLTMPASTNAAFAERAANARVGEIRQAVKRLQEWGQFASLPSRYGDLVASCAHALEDFDGEKVGRSAAE